MNPCFSNKAIRLVWSARVPERSLTGTPRSWLASRKRPWAHTTISCSRSLPRAVGWTRNPRNPSTFSPVGGIHSLPKPTNWPFASSHRRRSRALSMDGLFKDRCNSGIDVPCSRRSTASQVLIKFAIASKSVSPA